MALEPCRECGKQVSDAAEKCPHCGVGDPTGAQAELHKKVGIGCASLIAFVFLLAIWPSSPDAPGTQPGPTSGPRLEARVTQGGGQLHVTNQSSNRWTNCTVEINAGIIRGGWSTGPVSIPAGEIVSGGLLTFTRSGGERFNPGTHQVETVTVSCDTPAGRAHYFGQFN